MTAAPLRRTGDGAPAGGGRLLGAAARGSRECGARLRRGARRSPRIAATSRACCARCAPTRSSSTATRSRPPRRRHVAKEHDVPVLHIAARSDELRLFRDGAWEHVGSGEGSTPEAVSATPSRAPSSRGRARADERHRQRGAPRRSGGLRAGRVDARLADAGDPRASPPHDGRQTPRLAHAPDAAGERSGRARAVVRTGRVDLRDGRARGPVRRRRRVGALRGLAAGLGRDGEALRPLRPRRGASRPLDGRRRDGRLPPRHRRDVAPLRRRVPDRARRIRSCRSC